MEIGKEISKKISNSIYISVRNPSYRSMMNSAGDTVFELADVSLWDSVNSLIDGPIYYMVRNSIRDSVINPATWL